MPNCPDCGVFYTPGKPTCNECGCDLSPISVEEPRERENAAQKRPVDNTPDLLEQPIGVFLSSVYAPLSPENAATIIIRVALAVDALHKNGWIHGSLAPDKIYISPDRALGTLAHFGTLIPDKKNNQKKIDIYALGMLLYRLLVGNDPQSEPEKFPKMNIVPKPFADVIYKAMALNPNSYHPILPSLLISHYQLIMPLVISYFRW